MMITICIKYLTLKIKMNFITGNEFKKLSNFVLDENGFVKTNNNNNEIPIFFVKTDLIDLFYSNYIPNYPFKLITHNSDYSINKNYLEYLDNKLLVSWYSQNVNFKHKKLKSIPIGLENSQWFPETRKIEKLFNINSTPKNIKNLVYLNLNILNNPGVRQPIYDMLNNKPYVTTQYGRNGLGYDEYLDNLYNHKFMICPEGNGIDVHQPWESLYVNTIPIQKKNINNSNWRELPICWLDDWEQLTDENFLISEYKRIFETKFDLSKLDFDYWKNKIQNSI